MPVGLQFMYRHITRQYIQTSTTLLGGIITVPLLESNFWVSNYLSLLDAPASRQLIANFSNLSYAIDNSEHTLFYNELKNIGLSGSGGYPINSRNIAISNGSECGNIQDFSPGDQIVNYQYNKGLSFWGDLASLVYNPLGGAIGGLFIDNDFFGVAILGLIPGQSRYNVDFQVKSIPYGTGNQIYKGVISYTKKILWLINVTVNITNVQKNQPSSVLPFDSYGGGFFNINNLLDINNLPSGLFIRDKFSFIPTASALDIGKNNVNLGNSDYLSAYVGANPPSAPKNSPFANFSTEFDKFNPNAHNKQHISFNTRNGDWLAAELIGTNIEFTDCSFVCNGSTATITGGNTLCNSNVYSVNVGSGAVVNWSVSNTSAASLSSSTGASVTVTTPTNSYRTNITLTAIISSSKCGSSITLTKNIRIGKPDTPSSINGPALVNTGALVSYRAGVSTGATSYAWYLPYPYTTVFTFDYSGLNWQLQAPGNTAIAQTFTGFAKNAGYVQVMGENACGKGGAKLLYVQHQSSGGGGGPGGGGIASVGSTDNVKEVSLYPNPAKNKVTVSLTRLTEYESEPPTVIYGIKIMDLSLIERKFYQFRKFKNQETINVGFLETGLYSLIVYTDTATFTKMLLIR